MRQRRCRWHFSLLRSATMTTMVLDRCGQDPGFHEVGGRLTLTSIILGASRIHDDPARKGAVRWCVKAYLPALDDFTFIPSDKLFHPNGTQAHHGIFKPLRIPRTSRFLGFMTTKHLAHMSGVPGLLFRPSSPATPGTALDDIKPPYRRNLRRCWEEASKHHADFGSQSAAKVDELDSTLRRKGARASGLDLKEIRQRALRRILSDDRPRTQPPSRVSRRSSMCPPF
ncbi:hypothetical protein EJ06DRAFT_85384 [Trichodelitschia bisporula]|uniref:Uncharacterized protein n=1 Tax=Trichodelitschia bisporula TaxID=703511 RepID=A0A6G1HRS7_9PEZI|nr:hypothetical protein EJ06DRAFT_85384 [Trichodelitschia bisporula]